MKINILDSFPVKKSIVIVLDNCKITNIEQIKINATVIEIKDHGPTSSLQITLESIEIE